MLHVYQFVLSIYLAIKPAGITNFAYKKPELKITRLDDWVRMTALNDMQKGYDYGEMIRRNTGYNIHMNNTNGLSEVNPIACGF